MERNKAKKSGALLPILQRKGGPRNGKGRLFLYGDSGSSPSSEDR